MDLRHRFLEFLRRRLANEPLPLRLVFQDGASFDFTPSPLVTLAFHSQDSVRALLKGDLAGAADAYVAGKISVEGRIEDILKTGIGLAERIGKVLPGTGLARMAGLFSRLRGRRREAANVRYHYDVGNDFYRLWLDRRMVYSCAYFHSGEEDIDKAQQQKLDHICRKLMLKPGDRMLDIGCGWGGLLQWAASRYGVNGVGVTLSERQHSYAREAIAVSEMAERIEIRLQHYLDLEETAGFDKVVSVGMYEHVGLRNLPTYFRKVAQLLRPGGAFLNHGIVSTDPDGRPRGPPGGEFIDRHVFPGGAVPPLARVMTELSRTGLEFADAEDLRPHYALTLQQWSKRLEACSDQAIATAGPEAFRIWRVFLAGMAYAFDQGWLSVVQVLSFRPASGGDVRRPWTRQYLYDDNSYPERVASIRLAGKLDWT